MIGLGPEVCSVIGRPSLRAASQSRLVCSIVSTPRAAPPMLMAPTLREQMPRVSMPSFGIQSFCTRAMPAKSIGWSSGMPCAGP